MRVWFLGQSLPVQILCEAADLTDASGHRMKSAPPSQGLAERDRRFTFTPSAFESIPELKAPQTSAGPAGEEPAVFHGFESLQHTLGCLAIAPKERLEP